MKILVLNCGSSSLKYQVFNMDGETVLANGKVERIGMEDAILTHEPTGKQKVKKVSEIYEHKTAIKSVLETLIDKSDGVLADYSEIQAVGHRVVHGGESFSDSVLITPEVEDAIRKCIDLAPLHNPANLLGIDAVKEVMPTTPQVAVFDTAFHQTMDKKTFLYPIPMEQYKKYKIRRYGFHGTSHKYVAEKALDVLNLSANGSKIVSCHIGNGGSVTAIKDGKSVDTSMGMTPLEGLMMGTRSGDIDPAAVLYIMNKEELTLQEINSMLNKHSGLIGISGISSDMREIEDGLLANNESATLAFNMYEYRIRKYIGAYAAAMNGLDVLIFTAGVGENSPILRKQICDNLSYLGVELDNEKNDVFAKHDRVISSENSRVKVLVIPTNEELMIARDTQNIIGNQT
ncbi:acetate/propionate family kinase [Desulfuribacillus alkaliarsenatis]|uniref:Acetate kinase n=1 Tax=Desulfuribacillus alkaliarsenatis TaxID=766136 RepID=A0A1E5FZJ7_9FIRM|nr:acetate kinase [Desulfuribacillus alkaliarsenatis]OEF95992.1 acetate kinase [Desulfuribacillus alkaliarsenatis]